MRSRAALVLGLGSLCVASPSVLGAPQGRSPSKAGGPARARTTMSELLRRELSALRQLRSQRVELRRVRMGRVAVEGELRRIGVALGEVRRRREGLLKVIRRRSALLRARMRALYRLVRATARLPLLDSRRAHIHTDGRYALLRILGRDQRELRHLRAELGRLATELRSARRRRGEAKAVLVDLARRRDRIGARVAQCRQELASLRHRRRGHKGQASEWNATARALLQKITALAERLRREAVTFEQRRGRLTRPVPGMIVKWFGERKILGTKVTSLSKGVEISALPNWKVRAPAPGTVRFTGSVVGFGKVVIIDHDEGYMSVLGNLERLLVKVGDRVGENRVIAMFGRRSRRARPSIYFELRRGGRAIDPVPWLRGGMVELRKRGPRRRRRRRPVAAPPASGSRSTASTPSGLAQR